MSSSPVPPPEPQAQYTTEQLVGQVFVNVRDDIIQINSGKALNYLTEWRQKIHGEEAWHAPLGLVISIVAMFVTSDFKEKFGMTKDFWTAFFALFLVGSGVWLVVTVGRRIWKGCETPAQMVDKFKNVLLPPISPTQK